MFYRACKNVICYRYCLCSNINLFTNVKDIIYKYFLVTLKFVWVPQGDTTNLLHTRSIDKYFEIRFAIKPVTMLKKNLRN